MISISSILEPTGIDVSRIKYSGDAKTYITYFYYNERGEKFADDTEIATGYYLQVDVWSDEDCIDLAEQVKNLMINAGFKRTFATELYENETQIFHKVLRFSYAQNNEIEEEQ